MGSPGVLAADPHSHRAPLPAELAEIALAAAGNARHILDDEPRAAFVSFTSVASLSARSRFKSAADELGERVAKALATVRVRDERIRFERELQADVCREDVNTLVFTDHQAGNVCHMLDGVFGGARVVGPQLHGLAYPAAVVGAGISVEDLIDLTAMIAVSPHPSNNLKR